MSNTTIAPKKLTNRSLRTLVNKAIKTNNYTDSVYGWIGNWDTSNVTNMSKLFKNATKFNIRLDWDTSNVTDFSEMFADASMYNQPTNFTTISATTFAGMFKGTDKFDQDINFDSRNVVDTSEMFLGAFSFNSKINLTDTSKVKNMARMFSCTNRFNQPVLFNTVNVTDMTAMFSGAVKFNKYIDFNTENVIYACHMFSFMIDFNKPIYLNFKNAFDIGDFLSNSFNYTNYIKLHNIYRDNCRRTNSICNSGILNKYTEEGYLIRGLFDLWEIEKYAKDCKASMQKYFEYRCINFKIFLILSGIKYFENSKQFYNRCLNNCSKPILKVFGCDDLSNEIMSYL